VPSGLHEYERWLREKSDVFFGLRLRRPSFLWLWPIVHAELLQFEHGQLPTWFHADFRYSRLLKQLTPRSRAGVGSLNVLVHSLIELEPPLEFACRNSNKSARLTLLKRGEAKSPHGACWRWSSKVCALVQTSAGLRRPSCRSGRDYDHSRISKELESRSAEYSEPVLLREPCVHRQRCKAD